MNEQDKIILGAMASECNIVANLLEQMKYGEICLDKQDFDIVINGLRKQSKNIDMAYYEIFRDIVNHAIHYFACLDGNGETSEFWSKQIRLSINKYLESEKV